MKRHGRSAAIRRTCDAGPCSLNQALASAQGKQSHLIANCFEIKRADCAAYANEHQVRSPEGSAIIDKYVSSYAWQLRDVTRRFVRRPFKHPHGAITWVRLRTSEANAAAEASGANGAAEASGANTAKPNTAGESEANGAAETSEANGAAEREP